MNKIFLFFTWIFCLSASFLLAVQNRDSSLPYISGDTFRNVCDFILEGKRKTMNPQKVQAGDLIFVQADQLKYFVSQLHPKIINPYILITHNSDNSIPGVFNELLDDHKLIAWFGQNVENCSHPKMHPIPIGIANNYWPHGSVDTLNRIQKIANTLSKVNLLYMNFQINNFPNERAYVYKKFKNQRFCTIDTPLGFEAYLTKLAESKFVLSPRGYGLDCHRHWESMLMGAIPIIKSSSLDVLFEDLPALIIHDWDEVTEEFLHQKWEEMSRKEYHLEKLYADYWLQQIAACKAQFQQ